ncbi:hypothetical protein SPBR_02051 [Sporothrix brasiliensis 5110]|uniref:Uncharacterized protein n=1 Tax=Sporothrix brasiliensis 5110 TaxID=1398154 RepID=A0A0C2IRK7_9PEZI|nr:uncharacterized protein SPBR_02051 [Sporothrix brasiliensis 5110]KIH91641.1 hypothetical protein SPBR_02051 [Sporothrix brasiliensis 5110]
MHTPSTSWAEQPVPGASKDATKNAKVDAKLTRSKPGAPSRAARKAKPRNKASAAIAAATTPADDDQAGIIYPAEDAKLENIVAILDNNQATYKVHWMDHRDRVGRRDGTKYINLIWFNLVTQDTMAQLLASCDVLIDKSDVQRAFFYNEEDRRLIEQGVEDLVEGRGWFRQEEYDSDI